MFAAARILHGGYCWREKATACGTIGNRYGNGIILSIGASIGIINGCGVAILAQRDARRGAYVACVFNIYIKRCGILISRGAKYQSAFLAW